MRAVCRAWRPTASKRWHTYEDLLRELLEAEITNRHLSTARWLLREARLRQQRVSCPRPSRTGPTVPF